MTDSGHYPDWAPKDVALLQFADGLWLERSGRVPQSAIVREQLLRDPRMEQVWRTLRKHARAAHRTWAIKFTEQVCSLCIGPLGFEALSQKQARRVGERILVLLLELVDMMRAIPIEVFLDELCTVHHNELRNGLDELSKAIRTLDGRTASSRMCVSALQKAYHVAMARQPITQILSELANVIEPEITRQRMLTRPNHERASVHYFVRGLSRCLIEDFGHSLRQVVADIATVVFDIGPPLGKDDVARLTRGARSIPKIDLEVLRCWSKRAKSMVEGNTGISDIDRVAEALIDAMRAQIVRDPDSSEWIFKKWCGFVPY